jgi:hypothetical protein
VHCSPDDLTVSEGGQGIDSIEQAIFIEDYCSMVNQWRVASTVKARLAAITLFRN